MPDPKPQPAQDRKLLLPKFLTKELVGGVMERVISSVLNDPFYKTKRQMLHAIMVVPARRLELETQGVRRFHTHNHRIEPFVLCEKSVRVRGGDWPWPFDEIARSKAVQIWEGRNSGGTDIMPHLIFPGEAPYWGADRQFGVVVACSGVQPWLDQMIAQTIIVQCVGMAYEAWKSSKDHTEEENFLT